MIAAVSNTVHVEGGPLVLTPAQKKRFRAQLADFCERAEAARLKWLYRQIRRYTGLGVPPEDEHEDDCSAYAALGYFWAVHHSGVYVPDPLNEFYSGIGNTNTSYAYVKAHPAPAGKYLVGDLAFFGTPANTVHMSICRKAGNDATAIFSSNGHQSWIFGMDAPEPISLNNEKAREHLVGVFRHPALL